MTLFWIDRLTIGSSDKFIVKATGRFSEEYIEGSMILPIYIEPGYLPDDSDCVGVNFEDFFPFEAPGVRSKDRKEAMRIYNNFVAAMEFQGIKVVCSSPVGEA